ncbi:DUF6493 family protein [Bacteroides sp. 519]|uniref:DUF6493 family protein n=1 Tax=Bacteroides sp. 519 TaxID=2302937 RepID=UPI0013D17719|nr:DUF6493 family protein [Bacteroides sp. 519]NDV60082.1 hypothetical protein [Bacteroides sp. 519]
MKQIIELIIGQNTDLILEWAKKLTDEERYKSIELLKSIDISKDIIKEQPPKEYNAAYYDKYGNANGTITFMKLCCIRTAKDLLLTAPEWNKSFSVVHSYFCKPLFGVEAISEYFKLFPPDYLMQIVTANSSMRDSNNNFRLLWKLYTNNFMPFDEEIFVRSLFIITMFNRDTMKDVEFLKANPEAIDKVLLQFYKYELPVLDISKWQAKDKFVCKKCTEYWEEVFAELINENAITDRNIIRNLLTTFTYNWKKAHLDWHIRMLKLFKPTAEEYIDNQDYLYAALYSTNSTVVNFVVSIVQTIYKEERFDVDSFMQGIPNLFNKERSDKAILTALDVLSYHLEKNNALRQYAGIVAGALVQSSDKIQEKAATLLVKYTNETDRSMLVEPFAVSLKQKAREILQIDKEEVENVSIVSINEPIEYPLNWEDFLFHVGKTLSSLLPVDIDVMYESLIRLQDQLPEDYISQLKPYLKKLQRSSEKDLLFYIAEFFDNWIESGRKYTINSSFGKNMHPLPFMRNRNEWILSKLKRKNKLPLLSSPTHYPFFVHPDTLVLRLFDYENAGEQIEMEDLIVACNRILKVDISEETRCIIKKLKGTYTAAIQYLLGISGTIEPDNDTLYLWGQITRTASPNAVFNEYTKTELKNYPAIMKPFLPTYQVERYYSDCKEYHWDYLLLEDNWNGSHRKTYKKDSYPYLCFYTAYNGFHYYSTTGFLYWLSLVPHYCEPVLLHYIPDTASDNEVIDFAYCLHPLQFLIENQIPVYHGGWIYIALCLIFEKKVSRDLAAEYINVAFQLGFMDTEYLADCIATLIMNNFAPVNRLVEYLDLVVPRQIKEFQLLITRKCIEKGRKDALPTNYKKLVAYYNEICNYLEIKP